MSLVHSLKNSPLFHDILEEEMTWFLKGEALYTWHPGDKPCQAGNPIDAFFIILEGKADVVYHSWGREFLLQQLKGWDHFGEVIFGNDQTYPYTIIAETELTCLRIEFSIFKNIFEKQPQVYALFINNLLRMELNLKAQALGLVGRINEEGATNIGLPLYNRRKRKHSENKGIRKKVG